MNIKMSRTAVLEHTRHSANVDASKKQDEFAENNPKLQEQITEFRSVRIRKDVFELLKLYCLCHKQSPRELVTGILESKLERFGGHLEEIRKRGGLND
jgi:hypothetical protein